MKAFFRPGSTAWDTSLTVLRRESSVSFTWLRKDVSPGSRASGAGHGERFLEACRGTQAGPNDMHGSMFPDGSEASLPMFGCTRFGCVIPQLYSAFILTRFVYIFV